MESDGHFRIHFQKLRQQLVRELRGQKDVYKRQVKGGGVVINVTMDVLLIGVRGNDKSVPPLCPCLLYTSLLFQIGRQDS